MGLSCKINPLFTFRLLNLNLSVQRKFIVLAYFFYTLVKFIHNQFPFINYTPSAGLVKSLEKIKQADVVLYLFDVNITDINALEIINKDLSHQNKKFILIGNKSDIISVDKKKNNYDDLEIQFISAKENIGIDELKSKLFLSVTENKTLTENIIVTNSRHYEALGQVEKSLHDIKDGLESKISGDLLALDIRRCLYYLGEITGEITNEDRLDYIFSKFCIGK